jgi:Ras-related protein Rab-6A
MVNEKSVRLQLWDTAGQERFKSLIPGYLRDSQAIFLVYDITNKESYNNITNWIDYAKEHRGDDVFLLIAGNKIDD